MTTADLIISKLPNSPTVSPKDIAGATGMLTTVGVINAIQNGQLDAVKLGGRYIIARASAETYIRKAAKEASK